MSPSSKIVKVMKKDSTGKHIPSQPPAQTSSVAARIAAVIDIHRVTQRAFGERIGVTAGFVSHLVKGISAPSIETLLAIRDQFGVNLDWLLSGRGAMTANPKIDMSQLLDLTLCFWLARKDWEIRDPTARAAVRAVFGPSGWLSTDDTHLSEKELSDVVESAFAEARYVFSVCEIYNEAMSDRDGGEDPTFFALAYERLAKYPRHLSPVAEGYLRRRLMELIAAGRRKLEDAQSIEEHARGGETHPKPRRAARKRG
ncbi:MAG: helix-turn-helix domain-containing protein [Betaproteobacteria bacterium]|nr:helix-turn-helix domain-containing protein [Betaproteobacteria bacterium]